MCCRNKVERKRNILRKIAIRQLEDEFDIVKIFRTIRQVKFLRNLVLEKDQVTVFQAFKDRFIDPKDEDY